MRAILFANVFVPPLHHCGSPTVVTLVPGKQQADEAGRLRTVLDEVSVRFTSCLDPSGGRAAYPSALSNLSIQRSGEVLLLWHQAAFILRRLRPC